MPNLDIFSRPRSNTLSHLGIELFGTLHQRLQVFIRGKVIVGGGLVVFSLLLNMDPLLTPMLQLGDTLDNLLGHPDTSPPLIEIMTTHKPGNASCRHGKDPE